MGGEDPARYKDMSGFIPYTRGVLDYFPDPLNAGMRSSQRKGPVYGRRKRTRPINLPSL